MSRRRALVLALFLAGCDHCGCGSEVESLVAVAKCGVADGDVRRRPSTSSAWNSLGVGDALFPGDWVQTALSAAARVDFHTGARLQVSPGSTVVIEDPGLSKRQRVSVKSGRVEGELLANAELSFEGPDGAPVTLRAKDPTRYRLEVESGGGIEVAVTQGQLAVAAGGGPSAEVGAGEARTVRAGQPISAPERLLPAPQLKAPTTPARAQRPLTVEVPPIPGASRYLFEVSQDPEFQVIEHRDESDQPRLSFEPKTPGTYYVRATAQGPEGRSGTPSAPLLVEVLPPPPPDDLLQPPDGTVVAIDGGEAQVDFTWRPSEAETFWVVVGKEPSLGSVVSELSVATPRATVRLPIGRYVWGVYRVRGGQREPVFSAPRTLLVVPANRELKVPRSIRWR